jgi:hypothetical protein
LNITVLFAVALFLAAAFFVTYSEPNESDAATGTGTADDPWYCGPGDSGSVKATLINGVLTISGNGKMEDYTLDLNTVNSPWYSVRTSITSLMIESGVTSIGDRAFQGCRNLASVTIPAGVTSIGGCAFQSCTSLTSVNIPDSVETIRDAAFWNCSGLTSVNIPNGVETVSAHAFYHCTNLTSIVIPDSVETIGSYAFSQSGLTSIDIPENVTSVGGCAFQGCTNLTVITIQDGVKTIGEGAFTHCGIASVTIPNSVETIGDGVFANCASLTSVVMPDNTTAISKGLFSYCTSLGDAMVQEILSGVISIGDSAFQGCTGLISIEIPSTVETIGDSAFRSCTNLISVKIPNSAETIGDLVFANCTGLKTVAIPNSVETIGDGAFYLCTNLESVTIPDSVTISDSNQDYDTFEGCTNLETVTVTGISGGSTASGGIVDKYFKSDLGDDVNWKLPGMSSSPTPIKYLTLNDVSSSDYDPNNEDGKGGIAGAEGRELYYGDTKFTWNTAESEWDDTYTVTLTEGTGISGFGYTVTRDGSVICTEQYTDPFKVKHGDTLTVTALMYGEYAFVSWSAGEDSSIQDSEENPLTVSSVSGNISLTANGGLIEHYVEFDSGFNYTVYVNGSPVSGPVGVAGKGNLVFSVQTPEGYRAVPAIEGIADLSEQEDGSYRISEIHSNVRVTVTVTADGGNGSGSGNDSGNNSGNGNNSGTGSDGIPYWIPVLIIAVFLALLILILIARRRKD